MSLSANLFRLQSSIQKDAGSRGAAPVEGARGRSPAKKNITIFFCSKFPIFSLQIYMKDPETAEWKEKPNFRFSFFELWSFCEVFTPNNDDFFPITRKIKIGQFFYYFPHPIHRRVISDYPWGGQLPQ